MVLAVMFVVTKFGSYLGPRKFNILTLEEDFLDILQKMDVTPRIFKWLPRLQKFEYTIQVESYTRPILVRLLIH